MSLNLNSLICSVLVVLSSASFVFGETELPDDILSMIYDPSQTYNEGKSVISSSELPNDIWTALQDVPEDTPPRGADGERINSDYFIGVHRKN
jgi:hypothetical protein